MVCLNIVWAAYIWSSKLGICKDFSLVQDNVKVQVPGFLVLSSRIQWTRSIWGKIHRFFYFLTRIQRECCKGGLEHISQKPWVDVARSRKTHPNYGRGLSRPYVSSQITVLHFQKGAEECVRELRNLNVHHCKRMMEVGGRTWHSNPWQNKHAKTYSLSFVAVDDLSRFPPAFYLNG